MKPITALLVWGSWGILNAAAQYTVPKHAPEPMFARDQLVVRYREDLMPVVEPPKRTIADLLQEAGVVLVSDQALTPPEVVDHLMVVRLKAGTRFGDAYRAIRNFDFGVPRLKITGVQPNFRYYLVNGAEPGRANRVFALAARMEVGTGEALAVGGVAVPGEYPRLAVIRVRGKSLAPLGIARPLANPLLKLFEGSKEIARNDDWSTLPQWEADLAVAHGVTPADAAEPLIVTYLDPGAYTAHVTGVDGGTGIALLEVHLVDDFFLLPAGSY